ncbi:MAG: adenine phosphoribosyltransferase [Cyanobacteria bacterium KgW148]|nr:adenine phosphoribosyltransferase [Cyanobacteria bacterium KgW148]
MDLKAIIRDVPDFPKPGIIFRDIMPLLAHPQGLATIVARFADAFAGVDYIVGIESRGFIIGAPLALQIGCGFVPVRKPNKLPGKVHAIDYSLEYGTDRLEMQADILAPEAQVLIIDDVIATGGTAVATSRLVEQAGARVAGYGFVVELDFLRGREKLNRGVPIVSLVSYQK